MNKKNTILLDKNYKFDFEVVLYIIIFFSLLGGALSALTFLKEPEYSSEEPVMECMIFFIILSILTITGKLTLRGYTYLDVNNNEIRRYFEMFNLKFTYLLSHIKNINEIGVSSLRHSYSSSSSFQDTVTKDIYFVIILKDNGKLSRISSENPDLSYCNNWANKLANKLTKTVVLGEKATPLHVFFNKDTSKYTLKHSNGLNSYFARFNGYFKYLLITFISITILITLIWL